MKKNPILEVTTVTTLRVDSLDFPPVIVCPPKVCSFTFFGTSYYLSASPKICSFLFFGISYIFLSASPKGLSLSTSLKFDLTRLANTTLNSETKSRLKLKALEVFFKRTAELRAQKILDLVNDQNMEAVFQGFQNIPEIKGGTVEVRMSSSRGSITSFGYGQPYSGR